MIIFYKIDYIDFMLESFSNCITQIKDSKDKYSAFEEIVKNCSVFDEIEDKENFIKAIKVREELQSTGIGHGVAIAHGKISKLKKPLVALGLSDEGLYFDDVYPERVKLVFIIASSPSCQTEYVALLGSMLRMVHDKKLRDELKNKQFDNITCHHFMEIFATGYFKAKKTTK